MKAQVLNLSGMVPAYFGGMSPHQIYAEALRHFGLTFQEQAA